LILVVQAGCCRLELCFEFPAPLLGCGGSLPRGVQILLKTPYLNTKFAYPLRQALVPFPFLLEALLGARAGGLQLPARIPATG
jgi:hypothetical protein